MSLPDDGQLPGHTSGPLAAIFATLAGEAGFTLTPAAARAASSVLGLAHGNRAGASTRLAVRLLDQATATRARRITTAPPPASPTAQCTIRPEDIPGLVRLQDPLRPARAQTRNGLVRL